MNYPVKCNMPDTEKEKLIRSEKYRGFLMYQFDGQKDYVISTVKGLFKAPTYYLFDAQEQPGLVAKFCKICRFTLASDFGVASLTPFNNNVFLEVGLMLGLGKPVIYLVDKDFTDNGQRGAKAIPFDLSGEMVVEHADSDDLKMKLEKEVPDFFRKVQLSTVFEKESVRYVQNKLKDLNNNDKKLLTIFLLERGNEYSEAQLKLFYRYFTEDNIDFDITKSLNNLEKAGFIQSRKIDVTLPEGRVLVSQFLYSLFIDYRDILKQLLFRD